MNIRDQIAQDFNKVLNLGDGTFGGTRDKPVVVLDEDDVEAMITAVEYLRCINIALERDWKIVGIEPFEYQDHDLVRFNLEAIVVEDEEIFKDSISYFFKCPKLQVGELDITQSPYIGFDSETFFPFPLSLGWTRFTQSIENEPTSLGTSILYNARSITLSLYVYHKDIDHIREGASDEVKAEFMENLAEVRQVSPEYDLLNEIAELPDILIQEFISKKDYAALALTALNEHFLKVRITAQADVAIIEAARSTLMDIRYLALETRLKLKELREQADE